jgi:hypothetical protein
MGSPYVFGSFSGMGADEICRDNRSTFGNGGTYKPLLCLSCKWFKDGEAGEFFPYVWAVEENMLFN